MPRKPAGKKADDAPPANDTATPLQGHPWWPDIDPGAVAKLNVYRLVFEDRPGYPGLGKAQKVNLTAHPMPPGMLTTERQIAENWGAGVYEVVPVDAANRFVEKGGARQFTIAGEAGFVPRYVKDFERRDEDEDDAGASEEVRLLKLKLAEERAARKEERAHYDALMRQQREAFAAQIADQRDAARAERESLGGLFEQIAKASQMQRAEPQTSALAPPDWMRTREERLETELRELRAKAHELELAKLKAELAKRGGSAPADESPRDDDWVGQFTRVVPLIDKGMEWLDGLAEKRRATAQEAAKVAEARGAFKLGERAVPRVEELRKARENGRTVDPEKKLARVFRELFADGMLPVAYVTELREHGITFGSEADGPPTGEAPPSGGDRAAVG